MERRRPAHPGNKIVTNRSTVVLITACAKDRKPILAYEDVHQCLLDAWALADGWIVGKYILLPDHVHLFCSPRDEEAPRLATWLKYWKSLASRRWPRPEEHPIWQQDFWDRQLRRGESYEIKAEYVTNNAVRHGLAPTAEDWPFRGEVNQLPWEEV